jgi:ABC-type multidrug transport system fused ATPase/permease subunit
MPPAVTGIVAVLRLLPRVHPVKPWLFAAAVVASAALPIAIAVLTGLLVGSIPPAVDAGLDSAAGGTTRLLLAAVAALVVTQRVLSPLLEALAVTLGRQVEQYLRERVMAAVGRPAGIAHLEDPEILAQLRIVRGLGVDTNRPDLAVEGLGRVLPAWLQALGSAAILCWFHWWLGLAWLVLWPVVLLVMQREYVRAGQVGYGMSDALRRAEYLRDLAITAPAAKELRIWGMLDWLVARFERAWRAAIEPVWRVRRPRLRVVLGASGTVLAVNLLSFGLLAFAATRGDLGLAGLAVYTQALLRANVFMAFDDHNAYLSYAAVSVPKILDLDRRLAAGDHPGARPVPPSAPTAQLRFEGVRFAYPGAERDVLAGLDLTVPAGRSLAIVGRNGAGKTSLVKLPAACTSRPPAGSPWTVPTWPTSTRPAGGRGWRCCSRTSPATSSRRPTTSGSVRRRSPATGSCCGPPPTGRAHCHWWSLYRTAGTPSCRESTRAAWTSPAASGSGSRWHGPCSPWRPARGCWCSTSRPPRSTCAPRPNCTSGSWS